MKRFCALILAAVLLLSAIPCTGTAAWDAATPDRIAAIYKQFLASGAYRECVEIKGYLNSQGYYAIQDINQDGIPELLVESRRHPDTYFCDVYLFTYDPENNKIVFVDSFMCAGSVGYSEQYNCLRYCYPRPSAVEGSYGFYQFSDMEIIPVFSLYYQHWEGHTYEMMTLDKDGNVTSTEQITEYAFNAIHNTVSGFDWEPFSDLIDRSVLYYSDWIADISEACFTGPTRYFAFTNDAEESFQDNPTEYLNQYVLVESYRFRAALGTLIRVTPVSSLVGWVDQITGSTLYIDDLNYAMAEWFIPSDIKENDLILFHFNNSGVVGAEALQMKKVYLQSWDRSSRKFTVSSAPESTDSDTFTLSDLAYDGCDTLLDEMVALASPNPLWIAHDNVGFTYVVSKSVVLRPFDFSASHELIHENAYQATYRIELTVPSSSNEFAAENLTAKILPGDDAMIVSGAERQTVDSLAPEGTEVFEWELQIDRANKYEDGGVYYFDVVVGSDQTVPDVRKFSIPLQPVNSDNNWFSFIDDVWGFENFVDDPVHDMLDIHRNALLQDFDSASKAILNQTINEGSKGHCYGMAVTAILNKMHVIDLAEYTKYPNFKDAPLDKYAHSLLCYYQILQLRPDVVNHVNTVLATPESQTLENLAAMTYAVKDGGCPVLLGYDCAYNKWGAHAVVAYHVEQGTFTCSASGKQYDTRIWIYDSNADLNGKTISDPSFFLLFNRGTDDWTIPYYEGIDGSQWREQVKITMCTNDLELIDQQNLTASEFNHVAKLTCSNKTDLLMKEAQSGNFWILSALTGQAVGETELPRYYSFEQPEKDQVPEMNVILPNADGVYSITTTSGAAEELDLDVLFEDRYVAVCNTQAQGFGFSQNEDIALTGATGAFQIIVADNRIPAGSFNTYIVTGSAQGNVTVSVDEEGLTILGDDLGWVTIEAAEGDKEDIVTIEDAGQQIVIGREDDKLVVEKEETHGFAYGDANHDGKLSVTDAVLIMKHRAGSLSEDDTFCERCANVDGKKAINIQDAVLIMKKRADKSMLFPVEQ